MLSPTSHIWQDEYQLIKADMQCYYFWGFYIHFHTRKEKKKGNYYLSLPRYYIFLKKQPQKS